MEKPTLIGPAGRLAGAAVPPAGVPPELLGLQALNAISTIAITRNKAIKRFFMVPSSKDNIKKQ
jgi:hypothetical protein